MHTASVRENRITRSKLRTVLSLQDKEIKRILCLPDFPEPDPLAKLLGRVFWRRDALDSFFEAHGIRPDWTAGTTRRARKCDDVDATDSMDAKEALA